ncbi:MAG: hypothetical protein HYV07_15165 [Deltaproteobacteria bacterium]|nr:hypothetical protein [Deltaproteobacteria bacterium]
MTRPRLIALSWLALFSACVTPSNGVPLDRPVYETLERLASSGVVDGHLTGTRPISGREAMRMISEAHQRLEQVHGTRHDWDEDLLYLVADVDTGVSLSRDLDWTVFFKPLVDPELTILHLSGPASTPRGLPVTQHALITQNAGVEASEGLNTYLRFASELGFGPFSGYVEPVFWFTEKTSTPYPNRAYAKLGLLGVELTAGLESLWWGQAKRGSLALSNNARPVPMVRLAFAEPVLLPWFLSALGPVQVDLFAAQLEEDRDVRSPALAGFRLNFKPHPALELGASRLAILGGEKVKLAALDILETVLGIEEELPSYTLLVADFRLTAEQFQVYGEAGMEDVHGLVQTDVAYILGVFVPYFARYFDARLEWADLSPSDWYQSPTFSSGYTHRGRVLGHPIGGGGRELYVELGAGLKGSKIAAFGAYQARTGSGADDDVSERHHQVGGGWEYTDIETEGTGFTAGASFAYDRVESANHDRGVGEDLFLASVRLRGRW